MATIANMYKHTPIFLEIRISFCWDAQDPGKQISLAYWASTKGFVNVFCYVFVCYVIIILIMIIIIMVMIMMIQGQGPRPGPKKKRRGSGLG